MQIEAVVECPLHDSFRVRQVVGMFDLPLEDHCRESFSVELPDAEEPWQVGMIVGPSGSGKSSVAREAYPSQLITGYRWPADRAVVDCFGELPMKQITHALTSVGFGSPPSWIKPYSVLSGGEQFRANLARALLSEQPLVVIDEFTSVVDRTVAKIGSAAVSRAIRSGRIAKRLVAVTCHYDVAEWLEPDWVLDMATGALSRRRLRRPEIEIEIFRCQRAAWRLFAKHHYLSADLNPVAQCYLACWDGQAVAFCALLSAIGRRGVWRISRLVVLPDYQGIGVGGRFSAAIGEMNREQSRRTTITTSHPAMIAHVRDSPRWRVRAVSKGGNHWGSFGRRKKIRSTSHGRTVVSAEYQGTPQRPGESHVLAQRDAA